MVFGLMLMGTAPTMDAIRKMAGGLIFINRNHLGKPYIFLLRRKTVFYGASDDVARRRVMRDLVIKIHELYE